MYVRVRVNVRRVPTICGLGSSVVCRLRLRAPPEAVYVLGSTNCGGRQIAQKCSESWRWPQAPRRVRVGQGWRRVGRMHAAEAQWSDWHLDRQRVRVQRAACGRMRPHTASAVRLQSSRQMFAVGCSECCRIYQDCSLHSQQQTHAANTSTQATALHTPPPRRTSPTHTQACRSSTRRRTTTTSTSGTRVRKKNRKAGDRVLVFRRCSVASRTLKRW